MNFLYENKQTIHPVFIAISVIVLVLITWQLIFVEELRQDTAFLITAPIIIILMILVLANFSVLSVRMTENKLIVKFGFFKKEFYIKNITELEICDYAFSNYGGFGIRLGRDKSRGFIARGGQGLKFKNKTDNFLFYFSEENPQQVFDLLKQYGAK